MRSMTGYGRALVQEHGREITVELRAVNHRFLDISYRSPRNLLFLEEDARRLIREHLSRGHFDISVNYKNTRADAKTVVYDPNLLDAYMQAFADARERIGISNDASYSLLTRLPEVLTIVEREEDREAVNVLFCQAMEQALCALVVMREQEGERLMADMRARLDEVEEQRLQIARCAPTVAESMRIKLTARLAELLGDVEIDPARLAQEIAFLAERAAIDEEIVRLRSHIDQMLGCFASEEPTGRQLDFLVQEMNREVNTIGSKSGDIAITQSVLSIKSQIEKIREQVQNIE